MQKNLILSIGFLLVLNLKGFSQSHIQSDRFDSIEKEINIWIEEGKIPSMAVAVAEKGKVIWLDAFGWANIEEKTPAEPNTIYALGSLAKSMAATGTMTLVDNKKIKLNSPVNKLIAPAKIQNFHGPGEEVELQHILNMSAGISHGWETYPDAIFNTQSEEEKNKFVDKIGLITFPPGKVQQYSNYSYGLLDLVMERVSGKRLEVFMRESVFNPLGMKNSFTRYQSDRADDFATLYNQNSALDPYHFLPYGGGGYFSTAEDLIRYGMFYLKQELPGREKILRNSTIDLMQHFDQGAPGMFKIGWFNTGKRIISNGNITGANAMLLLIPGQEIAIVCLTNTHRNSYADQMANKILDKMLPDFQRQMTPEKYASIFETPYANNEGLNGIWKGSLENSMTKMEMAMDFEKDGTIRIRFGDADWKEIQYPTFNQYQVFSGNVTAHIPMPEKKNEDEVFCNLTLYLEKNRLYGNVQSSFSHENGSSFSYGSFINLRKEGS